jgi:hypothetical protein
MAIEIQREFFKTREDVFEDLKKTGFWPTTFVSEVSPALPIHWHDVDIHGYVLEGRSSLVDPETGDRLVLEPGDKLVLPARTLHAEGKTTERTVYIVAASEPRLFTDYLQMRQPAELDPAKG